MNGNVGDEIVVDGRHINDVPRKGEILEVMSNDGIEHYRVRWDDGTECLFFPGSDAHVVHHKIRSPRA